MQQSPRKKIILLIGANEFVGRAILYQLLSKKKYMVRVLAPTDSKESLEYALLGAAVVEGSLTQRADIVRSCRQVDAIVFVAPAGLNDHLEEAVSCMIAEVARESGIQHFVYISSDGSQSNLGIRKALYFNYW